MSEPLARLRVRETHGIRRFLYPLSASLLLPFAYWEDTSNFSLTSSDQSIPFQLSLEADGSTYRYRLDFGVSLDPFGEVQLVLMSVGPNVFINDPLQLKTPIPNGCLQVDQQRFHLRVDWGGGLQEVIYDGISQLSAPTTITRNGAALPDFPSEVGTPAGNNPLLATRMIVARQYGDGCRARTEIGLTACKSWTTIQHILEQPQPNDTLVFTLPLAVTAPVLTCDFGIGEGIYGKLQQGSAEEIVWETKFDSTRAAHWSVSTDGRVDYVGSVGTSEAFLAQRWFHLIDSDKALAVAITQVPESCENMTVRLTAGGDVSITFQLGAEVSTAAFGLCYHFLNDVPAIAAATNPQSILLPPTVEVLPT